jgi:predicted GNAT superfamily acetyltransferase
MTATIRLLETPEDMTAVEDLQRLVWPGSETDVVPAHMLITAVHNGGLVLGAFQDEHMVGFVFGFPGLEATPDGPRAKHCSHMMGIHPEYRDGGLGFALKRAQWQMVRHQGLDHITWTYDPLMSRNAYLNIARLGAVCHIYRRSDMATCDGPTWACHPTVSRWLVDQHPRAAAAEQRPRRPAEPGKFSRPSSSPL